MALDLTIAGTIVALSIVLSGLLIGLGRAIGSHKVEYFGREELIQAMINAALVGAYATITLTATEISKEMVSGTLCGTGDAIENLQCLYEGVSDNLYSILVETLHLHQTVAYYQSMVLNFSTFSIQPLAYLSSVSLILEAQVLVLQQLLLVSEIHIQLLSFFGPQLLTFFFPLGLIFRAFFSTRKLGGFLIALSIGLYLLYPSLVMVFPQPVLNETIISMESMNNNTNYTITPILDLNDNYAIAGKLDNMTNTSAGMDFTGEITTSIQELTTATSSLTIFVLIAPLFSIIVTLIFIKEVTDIFGGEFFYSVGML
ncbi:MAG: hypothetical protein GY852_05715 [bacterium]|nr:hypothetical protein [bacterium]